MTLTNVISCLTMLSYSSSADKNILFSLVDIDECKLNGDECDINASCNNTEGSYQCTCNSGYQGTGLTCAGKRIIQVVQKHFKTEKRRCRDG